MAKINLDIVIKTPKGKDIPSSENPKESLTAREVVVNSLLSQTNEQIGRLSKNQCYLIYKRIAEVKVEEEVALSAEEITAIKALVDKFYGDMIVGQVYEILESENKKSK